MGKTLSLKMNDKGLKKINLFLNEKDMTPSELLRKALWGYVNEVNQKVNLSQQENYNQKVNLNEEKVNLDDKKVNLSQQKEHNQKVNPQIQIIENFELMEYLKRDHEWLQDRIKHFENTQDIILAKIDTKQIDKEKTSVSWVRM